MKVSRIFWLWSAGLLVFTVLFLIMLALTLNRGGIWSLLVNFPLLLLAGGYIRVVPILAAQLRNGASSPTVPTAGIGNAQGRISRDSSIMLAGFVGVLALMWLFTGIIAFQLLLAALYLALLGVWSWQRLFASVSST